MDDSDLVEHRIGCTKIYDGRIIRVEKWDVRLPSGNTSIREVVLHPGAVAIIAQPKPNSVLLVEQFRAAPGEVLLEIPAGKLEPQEEPEMCAPRELLEETGYRATRMTKVCEFFSSPGFADEKIHLFHATELSQGEMNLDEDEFVRVQERNRDEVRQLLDNGEVRDAKTLVALLWWLNRGQQ